MAPRGASRAAAISAAADLMQRHGYAATGLEAILTASGSPKGSFYFHFPDGKEQLAAEALAVGGRGVRAFIDEVVATATSPGDAIRRIAAVEARQLAGSGYERGCPVATVTLEMASRSEPIHRAAHEAFESWITALSTMLTARGVAGTEATTLARWAIAALEGALVLARAARDDVVVTQLAEITAETLDRRLPA